MVVFYVVDRLILKIYPRFFQRAFHTHSKLDGRVRTFIARRNITLPMFIVGYRAGARSLLPGYRLADPDGAYHGMRTFWILVVQKAHRNPHAKPAHIAADLD